MAPYQDGTLSRLRRMAVGTSYRDGSFHDITRTDQAD